MNKRTLFLEAISALAAIDAALGVADDGCNSPQRTIASIKLLHAAHRDDCQRIAKLEADVEMLRNALRRYGHHAINGTPCEMYADSTLPCTCGYYDLVRVDRHPLDGGASHGSI